MHAYRSHTCGQLRAKDTGETVRLSGWIHRKRDHGNLVFIDLRDHYGLTQCVLDVSNPIFKLVEQTRLESVVTVTGTVKNQGVGAYGALSDLAKPGTTVRVGFYLSNNPTITANDRLIGSTVVSSIPAGASVPLSVSATIPANLTPGTYYIGAIADDTPQGNPPASSPSIRGWRRTP